MPKKRWKIELSKDALKYLKKLERKKAQNIIEKLEELEEEKNPLLHRDVRALVGRLRGFYRIRVADLRILFEIDVKNKRIGVHMIIPRGNAY
jgi:mRNA-degrading endonuclease RelE of RelBE toxin-antitoxin system